MSSVAASASRAVLISSSSERSSRCGSRPPPRKARTSAHPSGARSGHFEVDPRGRQQGAALHTGNHKAGPVQGVSDLRTPIAEGDGRGRGVGNRVAEGRQRGVNPPQEPRGGICRHAQDDCVGLQR